MMNSRESDTQHTSRTNSDEEIIEQNSGSALVTLSLFLSAVVTFIPQLITSLLLIEISQSFSIEVGLAGQVRTIAFISSLVFALLMGVLSVRFSHKSLLAVGLFLTSISAIGSFLSPTFTILLIAYSLSGIAMGIVRPMANAMVGSLFTAEQRPRVISYLTVGGASAYLVGSLSISALRDWQLAFAILVLPLALLNVGLVLKSVPRLGRQDMQSKYMSALRSVLWNTSAMATLVSNALVFITWGVVLSYGASFFRQHFGLDASVVAYLYVPLSLAYILAGVLTGRIVHRVDRKVLTVISAVCHGACFVLFLNVPNLWISLIVWLLSSATSGMRYAAYNGIALEQVPEYRGTMMSLSQVTQDLGSFIGTGIGGAILVFASYNILSVLGAASIIAAGIFQLIVHDVFPVHVGRVDK
jgi:DHA1 family inner membrane transport protein